MKRLARSRLYTALGCALLTCLSGSAGAGIVIHEEGDKKVEVGIQIQLQYIYSSSDDENQDRIFFRRLRPYIEGSVTKNWIGKIEFDFGASLDADEVAVKDAYMLWTKLDEHELYWGNAKTTFSRELLTSSKRLELVERNFTGEHNFGTPDRMLGLRVDNEALEKRLTYQFSLGGEQHDPAFQRMDFDSPVSNEADWNDGGIIAGRVDYYPRGYVAPQAGDFHTAEIKYGFGAGTFYWVNDGDNNTYTVNGVTIDPEKADLDDALGYEISFALRGRGLSVDLVYQAVHGNTVDATFTGGLYLDGETDLDKPAVTVGYVLPDTDVELVVGWDSLDASNYEKAWTGTTFGVNYYLDRYNVKVQANYRLGRNFLGVAGDDPQTFQIQTQFVF